MNFPDFIAALEYDNAIGRIFQQSHQGEGVPRWPYRKSYRSHRREKLKNRRK